MKFKDAEKELAKLIVDNEAASGWGAAVGARSERIRGLRRFIAGERNRITELANKLETHLQLYHSSPGFHLSEGDVRTCIAALRFVLAKEKPS